MNNHKICFIICTNDTDYFTECERYLRELSIPDGFSTEVVPIENAPSMTAGYNRGMKQSDARYKVYLHQDVFILNRNFIADTLQIFQQNNKIGMIGMVGTKRLPENVCMWTTPLRTGALRSCVLNTVDDYFDLPVSPAKGFSYVQAVDGLLLMTQYDIPWREDLDLGWDFYDISQSLEFSRQGYRIAVPYQSTPWVLHDNGFLHLRGYHLARKNLLLEYFPERTAEIAACDQAYKQSMERNSHWKDASHVIAQALESIARAQTSAIPSDGQSADGYSEAVSILRTHLEKYQEDETYCILCLLANIYEAECAAGITRHILSRMKPDPAWITARVRQIKFHLWQLQYPFPADIQYEARTYLQSNLSETALQYFSKLTEPMASHG